MKSPLRRILILFFALALLCRGAECGFLSATAGAGQAVTTEKAQAARTGHGELVPADARAFLAENSHVLLLMVRDSRPEAPVSRIDLRTGPSSGGNAQQGLSAGRTSRWNTLEKVRKRVFGEHSARLSDAGHYLYDFCRLLI